MDDTCPICGNNPCTCETSGSVDNTEDMEEEMDESPTDDTADEETE